MGIITQNRDGFVSRSLASNTERGSQRFRHRDSPLIQSAGYRVLTHRQRGFRVVGPPANYAVGLDYLPPPTSYFGQFSLSFAQNLFLVWTTHNESKPRLGEHSTCFVTAIDMKWPEKAMSGEVNSDELGVEIAQLMDQPKTIIVVRHAGGEWQTVRMEAPPGRLGVRIVDKTIEVDAVKKSPRPMTNTKNHRPATTDHRQGQRGPCPLVLVARKAPVRETRYAGGPYSSSCAIPGIVPFANYSRYVTFSFSKNPRCPGCSSGTPTAMTLNGIFGLAR